MKYGSDKFPEPAGPVLQPLSAVTNSLQCSADFKEQKQMSA